MSKQIINVGSVNNDGSGDTLRAAGQKINSNFTEVYNTAEAAFNAANTNINGIVAQEAFDKANVANTLAQTSFDKANTANVTAQAAFNRANSASNNITANYNYITAVAVIAQEAFNEANVANTLAQSSFDYANTTGVTAQAAFDKANTSTGGSGNITFDNVNSANVSIGTGTSEVGVGAEGQQTLKGPGSWDDDNFLVSLPWDFNFFGSTYSQVYVGSNSYLTFGAGTSQYQYGNNVENWIQNVQLPGVFLGASDNSYQTVYATEINRGDYSTFTIRYEGNDDTGGTPGQSAVIWEATFYSNDPLRLDISQIAQRSNTDDSAYFITDGARAIYDFRVEGTIPTAESQFSFVTGTTTVSGNSIHFVNRTNENTTVWKNGDQIQINTYTPHVGDWKWSGDTATNFYDGHNLKLHVNGTDNNDPELRFSYENYSRNQGQEYHYSEIVISQNNVGMHAQSSNNTTGYDNSTSLYLNNQEGAVQLGTNNHTWTFNSDSNFYAPGNIVVGSTPYNVNGNESHFVIDAQNYWTSIQWKNFTSPQDPSATPFECQAQLLRVFSSNSTITAVCNIDNPREELVAVTTIRPTGTTLNGLMFSTSDGKIPDAPYNDGTGTRHDWIFHGDGSTKLPYQSINNRTGSGEALVFTKNAVQKAISTQGGTSASPTVERLVIAGGDGYQDPNSGVFTPYSEGGDIYLWAGRGADGGDIKIDAGNSYGQNGEVGGDIKIRGGLSTTGTGGFLQLIAGNSNTQTGGYLDITSGSGVNGGDINLRAGSASGGTDGRINLYTRLGDWSFNGTDFVMPTGATGRIVASTGFAVNTGTTQFTFGTDGGLHIPGDLNVGANATFGTADSITTFNGTVSIPGTIIQVSGQQGEYFGYAGNGVNALYAGLSTYTPLPNTIFQTTGYVNGYIQNNFENTNPGNQASAEWVVTADNGTDSTGYIDYGIAGSGWDGSQENSLGTAVLANDGWVYVQNGTGSAGGNLVLGATTPDKKVKIVTGGSGSGNIVAEFSNSGLNVSANVTASKFIGDVTGNVVGRLTGNVTGNLTGNVVGNLTGDVTGNVSGTVTDGVVTTGSYSDPSWITTLAYNKLTGTPSPYTLPVATTANLGGVKVDGTSVTISDGVISAAGNYGNSNVATYLTTYTGNLAANYANTIITQVSNKLTFTSNGAYIWSDGSAGTRAGSIILQPNTAAGTFAGVVIGGNGRINAPNGSTHILLNAADVTVQVPLKSISGGAATSAITGAVQIAGGIGIGADSYFAANVTVAGTAGIIAPNRPAFRVYGGNTTTQLTTTQNGTGILNANNWVLDYQQGGSLNQTTGVFTAPVAGLYQICVNARNSGYGGGISQLVCYKNSANIMTMLEFAASSTMNHAGVSTVAKLAVNDTLKIKVVGGEINFDQNDSWSVTYLG